MLRGNYSLINKSHARWTNGAVTSGGATTGVTYRNNKGSFLNPSIQKSRIIYWSQGQSLPEGYNVGLAMFPALKGENIAAQTTVAGLGEITGVLWEVKLAEALLSGSGSISQADLGQIVQAATALAGSGSIGQAAIQAVSALAATLAGSGSISQASLSSSVPMEATLSGTGTVAGTTNLTGKGRLEAEILPFTELSPENLAIAVLNSEIETGYNMEESLKLILSALVGKLSGASGTTVTIRDINDTVDRIIATVDSNGNRTSVTKDVT